MIKSIHFITAILVVVSHVRSQTNLGTTLLTNEAYDGYTLFHPHNNSTTYLINNNGELVHHWDGFYDPGNSMKLLESGLLLRTGKLPNSNFTGGGIGGRVELVAWNGEIIWSYELSNDDFALHHEVISLPNGNLLAIAWERIDETTAIQNGRDEETLVEQIWSEKLIEFKPIGTNEIETIWEWRVWDHLVQNIDSNKPNYGEPKEHPGRIDLNHVSSAHMQDWIHLNSIDYNEELDLLVLSSPFFNELWVIDHSTTTEEARNSTGGQFGMGGDILYRWGNPETYDRGNEFDRMFFGQHNVQWLKNNGKWKFLLYNNGRGRIGEEYSTIDIIEPPLDVAEKKFNLIDNEPFAPQEVEWTYSPSEAFYSPIVSSAQLLPNGNTLVCVGKEGRIFEINQKLEIVWDYNSPMAREDSNDTYSILCSPVDQYIPSIVFRAEKYAKDYSGLPDDMQSNILNKLESINCPLGYEEWVSSITISPEIMTLYGRRIRSAQIFEINGKEKETTILFQDESKLQLKTQLESNIIYLVKITYFEGVSTKKILIK